MAGERRAARTCAARCAWRTAASAKGGSERSSSSSAAEASTGSDAARSAASASPRAGVSGPPPSAMLAAPTTGELECQSFVFCSTAIRARCQTNRSQSGACARRNARVGCLRLAYGDLRRKWERAGGTNPIPLMWLRFVISLTFCIFAARAAFITRYLEYDEKPYQAGAAAIFSAAAFIAFTAPLMATFPLSGKGALRLRRHVRAVVPVHQVHYFCAARRERNGNVQDRPLEARV